MFFWLIISLFLTTCNFAQDHENIEQVGRIYSFWNKAGAMAIQEDLLYLTTERSGLQIIDISDPENPIAVGFSDNSIGSSLGLALQDDFAFLVDNTYNNTEKLLIYNISDPNNPRQISSMEFENINNVVVQDDFAIVSGHYGQIEIIDVSNPESPERLGGYQTEDKIMAVAVDGDIAYVAAYPAGLKIVGFSDPSQPVEIGSIETLDEGWDIAISGDYAYVINVFSGLQIIDISDPGEPINVDYDRLERSTWNVAVNGDLLFFDPHTYSNNADERLNELAIMDITNPEEPEMLNMYDYNGDWVHDIVAHDDFVYHTGATSEFSEPYLGIIDISDPSNPELTSEIIREGWIEDVVLSGNTAYLAAGTAGLIVIDITDPASPTEMGRFDDPDAAVAIDLYENYAFITDSLNGIYIIDISNSDNPEFVELIELFMVHKIIMYGSTAFVLKKRWERNLQLEVGGLYSFDISDAENIVELDFFSTEGQAFDIAYQNNIIFLADGSEGILELDVSRPDHIEQTGYIQLSASKLDINGNKLIIMGDGCRIYDISNYQNPLHIARIGYSIIDFISEGSYIFVATNYDGLYMFRISAHESLSEIGFYQTPGLTNNIYIRDSFAYLADGTNFGIYDFSEALAISDEKKTEPVSFYLSPIFPNPFNSSTTIKYSLPHSGNISLKIYTQLGHSVAILQDSFQTQGIYKAVFDGSNLPSGIYFVRLEADSEVSFAKTLLMK